MFATFRKLTRIIQYVGSSNINEIFFFSQAQIFLRKTKLLYSQRGDIITVITYGCFCQWSTRRVAVAQRIVTFLTNENVKPAETLITLRAQFGDETLSGTQVYYWSKLLKEGRTESENM